VSIEERILDVAASQVGWFGGQELRAIALDVRKLEDRVKQLEAKVDELHDLEKWLEGR
jgi:tetrahydromethanopterin S-methyltransferase subunit B